jgi:hypothetical protein
MDRLLKDYVSQHYRVGKRTLQRWFRAGVIPGSYRTRGVRGHYRIRKIKGVTEDDFCTFVGSRAGINIRFPKKLRTVAFATALKRGSLSEGCVSWAAALEKNVCDYNYLMKPLWGYERTTGQKLPFRTLKELREAATKGVRIGIVEHVAAKVAAKLELTTSSSASVPGQ